MSSPTRASGRIQEQPLMGDDEPLLGRAGDASQQDGKGLQFNLIIGNYTVFLMRDWEGAKQLIGPPQEPP